MIGWLEQNDLLAGCPSCRQTSYGNDPLSARVWAMEWMRKYRWGGFPLPSLYFRWHHYHLMQFNVQPRTNTCIVYFYIHVFLAAYNRITIYLNYLSVIDTTEFRNDMRLYTLLFVLMLKYKRVFIIICPCCQTILSTMVYSSHFWIHSYLCSTLRSTFKIWIYCVR